MTKNRPAAPPDAVDDPGPPPSLELRTLTIFDVVGLPLAAFFRMWSVPILVTALVGLGIALVLKIPSFAAVLDSVANLIATALATLFGKGPKAMAVGRAVGELAITALTATLVMAPNLRLIRLTAADPGCLWHMATDEQPPVKVALTRLLGVTATLCVISVGIAVLMVFAGVGGFMAGARGASGSAGGAAVQILAGGFGAAAALAVSAAVYYALLAVTYTSSVARASIEQRGLVSNLREWLRLGHAHNAVIAFLVLAGMTAFLALLGYLGVKTGLLGKLIGFGLQAGGGAVASLFVAVLPLPLLMFGAAIMLEFLDRTMLRIAYEDDPASADPVRGPAAPADGGAPAADGAQAGGTTPSAPRHSPLALPDGMSPAQRAVETFKAHRQLRVLDEPSAREAMLVNATRHLQDVVAHRTADEAMLVYRDCTAADPAFEPGAPARLGLARFALNDKQAALSLKLVNGFDKRFPGHPSIPVAYGLAHEALVATGKTELAERVLAAMLRRYPEHPMTLRTRELAQVSG